MLPLEKKVGWQKKKHTPPQKKKLAQHHLNNKAGVTLPQRLMMGKSEASSVHIWNKVAKSGHPVAADRDAGCRRYHRSP